MILTETLEGSRAGRTRKQFGSTVTWKSQFIEVDESAVPSPNAFLVEQSPGSILRPHFHRNMQFQVVVAGSGTLGRHELKPVMVHYAAPQTAYGPIVAGGDGLWYFTLRPYLESGAFFLPESAPNMDRRLPKKQTTSHAAGISDDRQLAKLTAVSQETLITADSDGLAAELVRVPPDVAVDAPALGRVCNRFYVVVGGTMSLDGGRELPRLSVVWVSADEGDFRLSAGSGGLEVVIVQFPDASDESTAGTLDPA